MVVWLDLDLQLVALEETVLLVQLQVTNLGRQGLLRPLDIGWWAGHLQATYAQLITMGYPRSGHGYIGLWEIKVM